jgi:hypothetical protein
MIGATKLTIINTLRIIGILTGLFGLLVGLVAEFRALDSSAKLPIVRISGNKTCPVSISTHMYIILDIMQL